MHNKIAFLTAAVTLWLAASCTQRDKCVENPLIESANTMTLDISKVELSDTATVLHTDAYFRPGYWIMPISVRAIGSRSLPNPTCWPTASVTP